MFAASDKRRDDGGGAPSFDGESIETSTIEDEDKPRNGERKLVDTSDDTKETDTFSNRDPPNQLAVDAERTRVVSSVAHLSRHVPMWVLQRLEEEAKSAVDVPGLPKMDKPINNDGDSMVSELSDGFKSVEKLDSSGWEGMEGPFDEPLNDTQDAMHFGGMGELTCIEEVVKEFSGSQRSCDMQAATMFENLPTHLKPPVEATRQKFQRRGSIMTNLSMLSHHYFDHSARALPFASRHDSVVLFVDISGFTKLARILDPETLSAAINAYFHLIVTEVTSHGGDVLKFAGDAVFVEWKISTSTCGSGEKRDSELRRSIDLCVAAAANCGAKIVAEYSNYPVRKIGNTTNPEADQATLNVHCAISVGKSVALHVGNELRREILILGEALDQLTEIIPHASLGEVVVSRSVLRSLSRICEFKTDLDLETLCPTVIARERARLFTPMRHDQFLPEGQDGIVKAISTDRFESWSLHLLSTYRQLLAKYVHPVVVQNDTAYLDAASQVSVENRDYLEEAELRNVFVGFIAPFISTKVSGDDEIDASLFNLLNDIMNTTLRELDQRRGHLRQFIVDDKGVVLVVTFGLRGSTFPNMVSEYALPALHAIHDALIEELGVQNRVGGTIGRAYCGVVGGQNRHEYAVLGPSVNLAARLMTSPHNQGIMVDDNVRSLANKASGFNALPSIKAKGYDDPVPVFQPIKSVRRKWGKTNPNFVGREAEIDLFHRAAEEMAATFHAPTRMCHVAGVGGIGKSLLMIHGLEKIRKTLKCAKKKVLVTKHSARDGDTLVPFSLMRAVLLDLFGVRSSRRLDDASSAFSNPSGRSWRQLDVASEGKAGADRIHDRLVGICREMEVPVEMAAAISQQFLGIDNNSDVNGFFGTKPKDGGKWAASLVDFMIRAIRRSCHGRDLTVVAVDDIDKIDNMSWKVLEKIFEFGDSSILVLCTSRRFDAGRPGFWETLQNDHSSGNRFHQIDLNFLTEDEMKRMTAITLGVSEDSISQRMLHSVMQSQGLPQHANLILEELHRTLNSIPETEDEEVGAPASSPTLTQLVLQRIDALHPSVRNVLTIGAIVGHSFDLVEVVEVLRHTSNDPNPYAHIRRTQAALSAALESGIVHEEYDSEEDHHDKSIPPEWRNGAYTFEHELLRSTILKLVLEERKRNIHQTIAETMETQGLGKSKDFMTRMRIMKHWNSSGNKTNASNLGLTIGQEFVDIGLNEQAIRLYEDCVDMWRTRHDSDEVDDDLPKDEVELLIKLYIAIGKSKATLDRMSESVEAYQAALELPRKIKDGEPLDDRSVAFPIFSGLFVALKMGTIADDENCSYEKRLVQRFIDEARAHGDPVFYARALSMQAEMRARLQDFEGAIETQRELSSIYDAKEHSQRVCKAFGSDRAAQTFSLRALWLWNLGRTDEALQACQVVVDNIMPLMDPKNVHNSLMTIYPLLWIWKDQGRPRYAREVFQRYVVEAFDEYFGEGGSTWGLHMYDPILMLLDLADSSTKSTREEIETYVAWSSNKGNLTFSSSMTGAMANYGRVPGAMSAEICLLLAQYVEGDAEKETLVSTGLEFGDKAHQFAEAKKKPCTIRQIVPVIKALKRLQKHLTQR